MLGFLTFVAPSQGRELKLFDAVGKLIGGLVAPSQGRELKLAADENRVKSQTVAPSQGRELKRAFGAVETEVESRPFTGA